MGSPRRRLLKIIIISGALILILAWIGERFFVSGSEEKGSGAIGLIRLSGPILSAEETLEELSRYARDDQIRAIILRLESPGGRVGASQEIYEAILKLREKKPVVASLGGIATSGAFYIAAACSSIVANPGTLTGSIGVIIQLLDLSDLLHWARIRVEVIKTGEFKDAGSFHRSLTARESQYFHGLAQKVLSQFIRDIGRGRRGKITEKKIREIADGRVFTGEEALSLGLVDELGGWETAVEVAKRLGGIEGEPRIVKPRKPFWERILRNDPFEEESSLTRLINPLWAIFIP